MMPPMFSSGIKGMEDRCEGSFPTSAPSSSASSSSRSSSVMRSSRSSSRCLELPFLFACDASSLRWKPDGVGLGSAVSAWLIPGPTLFEMQTMLSEESARSAPMVDLSEVTLQNSSCGAGRAGRTSSERLASGSSGNASGAKRAGTLLNSTDRLLGTLSLLLRGGLLEPVRGRTCSIWPQLPLAPRCTVPRERFEGQRSLTSPRRLLEWLFPCAGSAKDVTLEARSEVLGSPNVLEGDRPCAQGRSLEGLALRSGLSLRLGILRGCSASSRRLESRCDCSLSIR
mmetsp:Transcript_41950/g.119691  ORF Transcript_41950/g.119691 Transcript_41950/m.119691 type:complete len:284 (-) Transcript_41950:212-1063(-)